MSANELSMPRPPISRPDIREMRPAQVKAMLRRHNVGRIAFSFHDSVDIRPIHYVYSDGWLFGRTSPSDKLVTLRHNQWVAFEVDEVSGPFDWASVIVRGTFHRLALEGSVYDRLLYDRAVRRIRKLAPGALTDDDPVPFRTEVFGISIDQATGRICSSGTGR